jgi:hypothetical protein
LPSKYHILTFGYLFLPSWFRKTKIHFKIVVRTYLFLNVQSSHSSLIFQEEDNESVNENDADLNKSLNKQRRHAVAAAPVEQRRSIASRSTYKDKGGKSSQNSRMQRQLCSR